MSAPSTAPPPAPRWPFALIRRKLAEGGTPCSTRSALTPTTCSQAPEPRAMGDDDHYVRPARSAAYAPFGWMSRMHISNGDGR